MGIQNLLLFFLFLSIVHASNDTHCGNSGPIIEFPFWLEGHAQPQNCAPPGFNLSCNGQKYPILHIPGSGDFYVSSIYYSIRIITIQDVESCLPKRLLSFNLSSTPFMSVRYRNYTFFSCPKGTVISSSAVECASNATSDFFATKDQADSLIFSKCNKIATVPVPFLLYSDFFPVDLDLTWDERPGCGSTRGGINKLSDDSDSISPALLLFIIPFLFLLAIICCFACVSKNYSHQNSSSIQHNITELGGVTAGREVVETVESSTTQTNYKTITIGESVHVGDKTCVICLADYVTKDIIRLMPECQHCFHMECIDKWLTIKTKCPVCRISLLNTAK